MDFFIAHVTAVFLSSPCLPGRGSASSAPDTMVVGAPGGEKKWWRDENLPLPPKSNPFFLEINGWFRCIFLLKLVDILILWGVKGTPPPLPPPQEIRPNEKGLLRNHGG